MGNIHIGVNNEFVRHEDKSFGYAVEKAAELGYEYVEPMVHLGRELLSEAGLLPQRVDVRRSAPGEGCLREGGGEGLRAVGPHAAVQTGDQHGVPEAGHPFSRPRAGRRWSIRMRAPKPPWTTEEEDHVLMKYVLTEAAREAERRGIVIGIEPHQQYSKTPDGLDRIHGLVDSPAIGINFDTGNSYLGGEDPIAWLERVKDRLVHLHAKDISVEQSEDERGKVTGTPVGCACGEGVIDWPGVVAVCKTIPRDIVFSVECGTVDQAERSVAYLKTLI